MIAPNTQCHAIACVGENKFAVRLLLAREFWRSVFHLDMDARRHRAILRGPANFSEGH
jgi:hypothetical protein